jgi:hypothetical protein
VAPEEIVMKLALLTAVHAQLAAAVTGMVPVVAAALTLVVTDPTVTAHAPAVGSVSLFEHAAAANATAAETREASSRR